MLREIIQPRLSKIMITSSGYINFVASNGINISDWKSRLDFELSLIPDGPSKIIDIGCGDGILLGAAKYLFPECSCIGIDDFSDLHGYSELQRINAELGVQYITKDATSIDRNDLAPIFEFASAIFLLNTIEHWHKSPKVLLEQAASALSVEGQIIIAAPNNSNLKKRFLAICGRTQWSAFDQWFNESDTMFRGHIREPNKRDLLMIGEQIGCTTRIYGRNFIGLYHSSRLVRFTVKIINKILMQFPSLCSDLYYP